MKKDRSKLERRSIHESLKDDPEILAIVNKK